MMKIIRLESFLTNCGLRNYLFVRLTTDNGLTGLDEAQDMRLAPHWSISPVALCAAIRFGWCTPQVMVQENFADFDAPWRDSLVSGWTPMEQGRYRLPDKPGLGIVLDDHACARHPFVKHAFPSLWDRRWVAEFTRAGQSE